MGSIFCMTTRGSGQIFSAVPSECHVDFPPSHWSVPSHMTNHDNVLINVVVMMEP